MERERVVNGKGRAESELVGIAESDKLPPQFFFTREHRRELDWAFVKVPSCKATTAYLSYY